MIDMEKEQRRAKLVAMLRGYTPMEAFVTRDTLVAEYEALMEEPYRTLEEEAADAREAAVQRGDQRKADQLAADRQAIDEAAAAGFMDCKAIVRALYPERFPDRPVRWDAAYRWLADAGVEIVYAVEDGITDVPKAERTGCWNTDFLAVLEYKTAYYQQIALNDWTRNVEGAVRAGISQMEAEEMMGPRPAAATVPVDTAWKATGTKVTNLSDDRRAAAMAAMSAWTGATNKKGRPKVRELSAILGFRVYSEVAQSALEGVAAHDHSYCERSYDIDGLASSSLLTRWRNAELLRKIVAAICGSLTRTTRLWAKRISSSTPRRRART